MSDAETHASRDQEPMLGLKAEELKWERLIGTSGKIVAPKIACGLYLTIDDAFVRMLECIELQGAKETNHITINYHGKEHHFYLIEFVSRLGLSK